MKTAVVLFNLGGPDSLDAVRPFLFNLFSDKAIISLPQPLRYLVAKLISTRRTKTAKAIYEEMGGKSPILEQTQEQARALQTLLNQRGDYQVFVAMRYWHPFIKDVVAEVKDYEPDKIILLPLYPQFSTTTTGSSFKEWHKQAKKQKLYTPYHEVCCYPFDTHFIQAHLDAIKPKLEEAARYGEPRILFSAHGLPEKIIAKGDPYQWQVERTVSALMRKLGNVDYTICYQSRVGPLEWIKPSTDAMIKQAGTEKKPIVVVPIAFVSEHSETLVELDMEYRKLAEESGVPFYARVPALSNAPEFIDSLGWLVQASQLYPNCSNSLGKQCPKEFGQCGFQEYH